METITTIGQMGDFLEQDRRSVLLFHATWCPFCRFFKSFYAKKLSGSTWKAGEVLLDDDSNPIWESLSIDIVPTVMFYDGKELIERMDGKAMRGLDQSEFSDTLDRLSLQSPEKK